MTPQTNTRPTAPFYAELDRYLSARTAEFDQISSERKAELEKVAEYIRSRLAKGAAAKLTFICTHNSRRSHLSQIWAQVAAARYGVDGVETFSGGTEATAFNPRAVAALQRCGLKITTKDASSENPRYQVKNSDDSSPQECYSKVYDAPPNPTTGYGAIMTCSQADDACPLVMGSDLRIAIRYDDPKSADGTDQESQRYDERSRQICREMLYMMSAV